MQVVHTDESVVLLHDTLGTLIKLLTVGRRPPVFQVALAIELPALVIEAVRQFMPDDGPHRTVVHRIIPAGIEERRLQNPGGKVDVVHLRIVISIHCRRAHAPFPAVYRLADFGNVAPLFKGCRLERVAQRISASDDQGRVVTPFIRIADLIGYLVQFLFGAGFGGRAHPTELFNVPAHRCFHIVSQRQGSLFVFRTKTLLDIDLAQRFA